MSLIIKFPKHWAYFQGPVIVVYWNSEIYMLVVNTQWLRVYEVWWRSVERLRTKLYIYRKCPASSTFLMGNPLEG